MKLKKIPSGIFLKVFGKNFSICQNFEPTLVIFFRYLANFHFCKWL